jgi:hypothetical protein
MVPVEQKGPMDTIWYLFCLLTVYGICNRLEDGKSVCGRARFDNWSVCVDHCRNGVVILFKTVGESLR